MHFIIFLLTSKKLGKLIFIRCAKNNILKISVFVTNMTHWKKGAVHLRFAMVLLPLLHSHGLITIPLLYVLMQTILLEKNEKSKFEKVTYIFYYLRKFYYIFYLQKSVYSRIGNVYIFKKMVLLKLKSIGL